MSAGIPDREAVRQLVRATVLDAGFRRGTFAGAARGEPSPWSRVVIRPVDLRGRPHLQVSYFDSRKDISKNFGPEEIDVRLDELLAIGFAGIHLTTATEEIDIRTSKKGKVHVSRRAAAQPPDAGLEAHNRAKDLPLPEGRADHLLEVMGIMTADGRVRPTMRAKYTQINEFLKHLSHAMAGAGLEAIGRPVEVLDCGCGSSYLTLAVHHYLNDVRAIRARIVGVDVNEEVIRKSVARADRLRMDSLALTCGRIDDVTVRADIVLALHACDTATDDALARAVRGEARLILAVPCCHKDLNRGIRPEREAVVLRPLLRHGILRQRAADLVTDAFRDYRAMQGFWNATPYIERALGEGFATMVNKSGTD
jgi:SAM-dependent methyltransferase